MRATMSFRMRGTGGEVVGDEVHYDAREKQ